MARLIQKTWAFPRKTFHEGSNTLDLAYITPYLVATASPTQRWLESWYRQPVSALANYLTTRHGDNWRVWNLVEDNEISYTPEALNGKVIRHPILDHTPPPVELLAKIIREIHTYVEEDPRNVAVVHCKRGKGRTGTVICAYLVAFQGLTLQEATSKFTERRMRYWAGPGVSIISQMRYLGYVTKGLVNMSISSPIHLVSVTIRNPQSRDFDVSLTDQLTGIHFTEWSTAKQLSRETEFLVLKPRGKLSQDLSGDLRLVIQSCYNARGFKLPHSYVMASFNVHYEGRFRCNFTWTDFDGSAGSHLRGTKSFDSVEIEWSEVGDTPSPQAATNSLESIAPEALSSN